MKKKKIRKTAAILLCLGCLTSSAAQIDWPDSVTISRRVAAYSTRPGHALAGYFPAGASLSVLSATGQYARVRFTSPSGRVLEALCRPVELGLTPVPVQQILGGGSSKDTGDDWTEVSREALDVRHLTPRGRQLLEHPELDWNHAQTPHFAIHYQHGMFARRVARLGEFFYDYIRRDLKGPTDLFEGRSHIFIFRETEEWSAWVADTAPDMEWAIAFVSGPMMYMQDDRDDREGIKILAHEMTHLVLNRFFRRSPPLWLNEGLAEWYADFAYAEYKGVYQPPGKVFRDIDTVIPLPLLLRSTGYPREQEALHLFYQTSKYLVGFLRLEHEDRLFLEFMNRSMSGESATALVQSLYGYTSIEPLADEFQQFTRHK